MIIIKMIINISKTSIIFTIISIASIIIILFKDVWY